jgi:hypothetical protein
MDFGNIGLKDVETDRRNKQSRALLFFRGVFRSRSPGDYLHEDNDRSEACAVGICLSGMRNALPEKQGCSLRCSL